MRLVQNINTKTTDPAIIAILSSSDLNMALKRIAHYKPIVAPVRLNIEQNDQQTSVTFAGLPKHESLQRRPRQEGTTFQKVLDELREELARHYLSTSHYSSEEIAFLLGYEEPNSFFRAFRAWTGQTPEVVRANRP